MAIRLRSALRNAQDQQPRGAMLDALYDAERVNGWSEGMQAVTLALLEREVLENVILEVGCGDGALLAALAAPGRTLIGLDLRPRIQTKLVAPFVQADAQRIPCANGSVDTILALDVFDQQGVDLAAALAESRRALRPGGILLLRVSAHGWLYGPHDAAFNSGHRYSRAELLSALADAGFRVRRQTYANSLLAPLLILQRLLQRWRVLPWTPAIYRAGWSNRLVAAALKVEARWLRRRNLNFGLSLIMIAEIEDCRLKIGGST